MRIPAILVVLFLAGCGAERPASRVQFTWLSNTTWLIEADGIQIFIDAALTRWDFAPADFARPESFAIEPLVSDTASVGEILRPLIAAGAPSYILVGHAHADHVIDLAPFAKLTDARIIGARTVCLLAQAQGLGLDRCRVVEGSEVIDLTPRLQVRVVRWAHSGDPDHPLWRFIQAPMELRSSPHVDRETGGIALAPWQGGPNGGGARAYFFRYVTDKGLLTWLVSDTGNPFTFDSIPHIGVDYLADVGVDLSHLEISDAAGTPREWLTSAVVASGIDTLDIWIGYPVVSHLRQVHDVLPSKRRPSVEAYLDSAGVRLLPQSQYLERYELTKDGLRVVPNERVQEVSGLTVR